MKHKRIFALILSALILLSAFVSCGQDASAPESAPPDAETETTEAETTEPADEFGRPIVASSLPDDLDLGGATVNFLYHDVENPDREFLAEAENGEIINDAIFKRNREVEERLNVKLNFVPYGTDDTDYFQFRGIKNSVMAGDGAYDIIPIHAYYGSPLAPEGYFADLLITEYFDETSPWWNKSFVEELTIFGCLWTITGDLSLSATSRVYATFFNKKLQEDYYKDLDFYDEVYNGKWTIDRFGELVKDEYSDLNGNSERDDDDFYAWFAPTASVPLDSFQAALDLPITKKDEDGVPRLVYNNEKTAQAYQKVYDLYFNNNGVNAGYYTVESIIAAENAFLEGRSIFLIDMLSTTDLLRDMEDDYGVLPVFKWDEVQPEYHTTVHDSYSIFGLSASCSQLDTASAVLEAMGEYSYRYVTPAYFEIALKRKYARGDNDAEMYDLILAGRSFNFGVVNSNSLNDLIHLWRSLMDKRKLDWQSTIDKQVSRFEKSLDKLLGKFEELSER
ncbi:MAG: hypothetical protein ACOX4O_11580 [Eubacteriales bacterium]|jgi:hypothetical protein